MDEMCEFYNQNMEFCRLAGDNCFCVGECHYCTFPQQLSKERNAAADDMKADAEREDGFKK